MQFFAEVGLLGIASRLKMLSDRLYDAADRTYDRHGINLQARWFPVLRLLHDKGPQTVGEIAVAVGQTHSAISQLATKLTQRGMLESVGDQSDGRVRRLSLTPGAIAELRKAKPYWHAIREELDARFRSAGIEAWSVLDAFGEVLDESLEEAIAERAAARRASDAHVVPFRPDLREHFYRLNADWLRRYFYLEEVDQRVLSNPEGEILDGGGAIFFAMAGEEVVGTCALVAAGTGEFELTKMAVDPAAQGLGIGRLLIEAALAEFESRGGRRLFLETNTRLAAAIRLYESVGFVREAPPDAQSHYQRADTYMAWRGRAG